jgi:hypothetical protein
MRWAGHVARMGEGRGAYRCLRTRSLNMINLILVLKLLRRELVSQRTDDCQHCQSAELYLKTVVELLRQIKSCGINYDRSSCVCGGDVAQTFTDSPVVFVAETWLKHSRTVQ